MTTETTQPPDASTVEEGVEKDVADDVNFVQDQTFNLTIKMPQSLPPLKFVVHAHTSVQEIRQVIFDASEAQGYTCFHLMFDEKKLSDVIELGEVEGFGVESVLELVEGEYTDREVRVHLTRFRETLTNFASFLPSFGVDHAASFLSCIEDKEENGHDDKGKSKNKRNGKDAKRNGDVARSGPGHHAFADYDFDRKGATLLNDFIPHGFNTPNRIACLKSLSVSPWNPPPFQQKSRGDLLYLRAETLEGEVLHLTCCASGFYVNASTDSEFHPFPRQRKPCHEHNVHATLSKASQLFEKNFTKLQAMNARRNPLEYIVTASGATPWAVKTRPHSADPGRSLDAQLTAAEHADAFGARDWNEDFQSTRDLPRSTPQEKVLRDQAMYRTHADFIEAAVRGAVAVLNGSVMSLNPQEPGATQMYLHNNIFFSQGYDQREAFEKLGGPDAAHVAVSKDVDGVRLLSNLEIDGLHTLGTAVIDYMGQRIVGQTVIPGILSRRAVESESLVKYGSVDLGKEIFSDEGFHALTAQVAKALHLAEHEVIDGEGKVHKLFTSVDTKGIIGTDGRRYLLDLYRITPVDIEFIEQVRSDETNPYPHEMTLLRPELIDYFYETRLRAFLEERQKEEEAKKSKNGDGDEKQDAEDGDAVLVNKEGTEEGHEEKGEDVIDPPKFELEFNTDVYTLVQLAGEQQDLENQRSLAREANTFLRETMIQRLVVECIYQSVPIDGEALTKRFHQRGVNMRYLGKTVQVAESTAAKVPRCPHEYFTELCKQEMIARAAKHVLRDLLKDTPLYLMGECVSHFLNCLFCGEEGVVPVTEGVHGRITPKTLSYAALTPAALHERIQKVVAQRFRFEGIPKDLILSRRVPLLRSICLKVGLQIEARDYEWDATPIFGPSDIVNHYPVVKHAEPRASFAEEAMEHAQVSLAQEQLPIAIDIYQEAAAVYEQVYGPVHPDTGRAYSALAMAHYQTRQFDLAQLFQRKAVVVSERTQGVDDPDVLQNYMNLAYFEFMGSQDSTRGALTLMRHALRLWEKLGPGARTLESASTDANIAAMLQQLGHISLSNAFYERARETHEILLGKDHHLTGASYDALVKGYVLASDFRKALGVQKLAWEYLRKRFGETDERVVSAETVLRNLTERAVSDAKKAKLASHPQRKQQPTPPPPSQDTTSIGSKGSLPIDELLKFIGEGGKKRRGK
ncbi:hypothetical protein SpCBS45565_g04801 [Spizellomyces sp. 'palustris']|nr:hypothetical protein SpCBS45565_g04801 [Spizellomyces sp. 'palustris']